MTPLLILVDLQKDYLKGIGFEPATGVAVNNAASLVSCCRERDIHVAHLWTTVSREKDNRMPHWKRANIWLCEEGTSGHQPPETLAPLSGDTIIHKSGFCAPNIAEFARGRKADTLIIAGVKTHACIRQVALDAWQAGLAVWIAADAITSDDPLHAVITRRYLQARGVNFLSNSEITARLDGGDEKIVVQDRSTKAAAVVAHNLSRAWRNTSSGHRSDCVRRLTHVLSTEIEQFALLMAQELGKPVRFGRREVQDSLEMLNCIVSRAKREGEIVRSCTDYFERRRPDGVIAAITPWNNPIYLPLGKIVPAVMYSNAVVWKPAPEAVKVSRHLFQCFARASWPEGLVQVVEGGEREAVDLMEQEAVNAVTMTGSSSAGYVAQEICARRHIELQAELGGNNAAIVWSDADLRSAARMIAAGAFELAGQRCTANRRVVLHHAARDEFLQLLLKESAALKWGDPLRGDTDIGPLVNEAHRDRVAATVERAVTQCGRPLLPLGDAPCGIEEHTRRFYPPTILFCEDPAAEIVQEETFGPVTVVQVAHTWEHAIRLLNDVRQGLVAAVFTSSRDIARNFLEEAEAGILKVNQSTAGATIDVPFGGWKASSVGVPEHGRFDIEFLTRPQTVYGIEDEEI